jgi:hypothetical protein
MATKLTQLRHAVEDAVASGNATIGSINKRFGFMGLRDVAKHVRFGRYAIEGNQPDATPHLDADADIRLAKRFQRMAPNTRIVQQTPPPRKAAAKTIAKKIEPDQNFAGELADTRKYVEGAVFQVLVNRYERDPKARAACLKEFGCRCSVCGFDFGEQYGEIGDGFIHVHHRKPIALQKAEYRLEPTDDLAPVCPNCHAMLHTSDPPLEIDQLREMWRNHGGA